MVAITLDGIATASAVKGELADRIAALKAKGITPGLGTLLVGDDPGSRSYVARFAAASWTVWKYTVISGGTPMRYSSCSHSL